MPVFDPMPLAADLQPIPIGVYRYRPEEDVPFEPLPNVRCTKITWYEGAHPADAEFRYVVDPFLNPALPTSFTKLVSLGTSGPGVLLEDDRVVVVAAAPSGELRYLFDGFIKLPELSLTGDGLAVPIRAVQVAIRAWDSTFLGGPYRQALRWDDPEWTVPTMLPGRFNPSGKPNCTGPGYEYEPPDGGLPFPVFIDEAVPLPAEARTYWTVDRAVQMILGTMNNRETWITNPTPEQLETSLTRIIATGADPIDLDDPETFDRLRVVINDQAAQDRTWPEFVEQLLAPHGFRFRFSLRADAEGRPETYLTFYHVTDPNPGPIHRVVYLQPPGSVLDANRSNLSAVQLQRDSTQLVNRIQVRFAPTRIEMGVILLPGFEPEPDDADPENIERFRRTKESPDVDPRKYRSWTYNETGEGVWRYNPGDVEGVYEQGPEVVNGFDGIFNQGYYAQRRRPAQSRLLSADEDGRPRRPMLGILVNYSGEAPGIWDGSGDVYWIKGGWRLDEERLGIVVEANDPNDWAIGGHEDVEQLNGGHLRLIDWLNGTNGAERRNIALVLVCVLEDDFAVRADPGRDPHSPTRFEVSRAVDSSDRHRFDLVHASSPYFDPGRRAKDAEGNDLDVQVNRDDREQARSDAISRRAASAYPVFAGSMTLPRLSNTYPVGARITRIVGHDMSLRLDGGSDPDAAVYPRIVQVTWDLDQGQYTRLQLTDGRATR
ncbi:hypothetical protein AB1L88_15770 [Tautonia sp. JC769]|uniref:hypothetical protein n=1 Tax=Tautonia sp. JC769 TaxID=3232135 RepID=UPI003458C992